jgi:hypothetical protein
MTGAHIPTNANIFYASRENVFRPSSSTPLGWRSSKRIVRESRSHSPSLSRVSIVIFHIMRQYLLLLRLVS